MTDLWQPIVKHVLHPLQARWEGSSVPSHLADLEKSQWWPVDRLRAAQLAKLQSLLDHAYRQCPYYAGRLAAAGFKPGDLTSLDQVVDLPLLTKDDIRNNRQDMLARDADRSTLWADRTGGSTGQPLEFHRTRDRQFQRAAAASRHDRWTGWDVGHKAAYFWGHRQDLLAKPSLLTRLRNQWIERRVILDTSSITSDRLDEFRLRLLDFRPVVYIAYANAVYLYARFLEETGRDHHQPQAVITSAEFLEPDRREVIERVLGCRVFDRYGARETSVIASECEAHDGLHLCAENLYVEFVREGRAARPGERGRVVVTDLDNPAMPFIRYEIADVGVPGEEAPCSCGRGLPRMEVAGGRVTDFLLTPDGKIVSGASLTIYLIANTPGVAQAQLVQEEQGRVLVRLVPGEGYGDRTLAFLREEMPRFFGPDMLWDIEEVEGIPAEPSGKYRFSICKLDPASLF